MRKILTKSPCRPKPKVGHFISVFPSSAYHLGMLPQEKTGTKSWPLLHFWLNGGILSGSKPHIAAFSQTSGCGRVGYWGGRPVYGRRESCKIRRQPSPTMHAKFPRCVYVPHVTTLQPADLPPPFHCINQPSTSIVRLLVPTIHRTYNNSNDGIYNLVEGSAWV
jgi:hypothetical protein